MMSAAQLVRMVGAVIVVIAVQFLSPLAQAHSGHAHGLHAHHGAMAHHHAAMADADHAHGSHAAQPAEVRSADQTPAHPASGGSGCVGGCCSFGVSCCGSTALSVSADQFLPSVRCISVRPEQYAAVRGIDPEALRKPPRSLA